MTSRKKVAVAVVLLSFPLAVGCAKRPSITQAAAPPPTGAAVTVPAAPPPVAPAPAAPVTPAPAPPVTPPPPVAAAPPAPAPAPVPPPARPVPAEFKAASQLADVLFDFDRYEIRKDAARTLDASVDWLKSNVGIPVLIEGHCDERGTNAYNLVLGEQRAKAARDYLVARGVAADRITIISYGEERPVCTQRTEACWGRNRRAHFLVKLP